MSELLAVWSAFTKRHFKRRATSVSEGGSLPVDFLPLSAPETVTLRQTGKLEMSAHGRLIQVASYLDVELAVTPVFPPANVVTFEQANGALPLLSVLRTNTTYSLARATAIA